MKFRCLLQANPFDENNLIVGLGFVGSHPVRSNSETIPTGVEPKPGEAIIADIDLTLMDNPLQIKSSLWHGGHPTSKEVEEARLSKNKRWSPAPNIRRAAASHTV